MLHQRHEMRIFFNIVFAFFVLLYCTSSTTGTSNVVKTRTFVFFLFLADRYYKGFLLFSSVEYLMRHKLGEIVFIVFWTNFN